MARTKSQGRFSVNGDPRKRELPTVGAAISLGLTFAARATEPNEWGVREHEDRVATVVREADGAIVVTRNGRAA